MVDKSGWHKAIINLCTAKLGSTSESILEEMRKKCIYNLYFILTTIDNSAAVKKAITEITTGNVKPEGNQKLVVMPLNSRPVPLNSIYLFIIFLVSIIYLI